LSPKYWKGTHFEKLKYDWCVPRGTQRES
jgi:hypothetical protein